MPKAIRFAVALLVLLLIAAAWWPSSQTAAIETSAAGLKRAMAMYAVARGMNAVISVAQGTQIVVEPLGVGAVVALGQALDPINDLIEQFSALMLMAAVVFGLQILLIKIGAHWAVTLVLTLVTLVWFSLWWWRGQAPHWLARVLLVLVLVRFAVPVSALATDAVYRGVMTDEYAQSEKAIAGSETARRSGEDGQPEMPVIDGGPEGSKWSWPPAWFDVKRFAAEIKRAAGDVNAIVADMKRNAQTIAEHLVRITVVFLLQTLVLPLLFLWLLIALARNVVSGGTVPSVFGKRPQS